MSLWTGWTNESTIANIVGGSKKVSQINERLRLKDKEELAEEIVGLRINNNIQTEEIKLLKIEIQKIRKKTGTSSAKVMANQEKQVSNQNAETVLINPYDMERLKE